MPPCPEFLQSPPPKPCTLRDKALELANSFQGPQESPKLRKAKTFASPAAATKVFARPAAATALGKPKVARLAAKKKPAACKKPAAATKQALSQSFACVVSRAYHAARNRALAAGQSKESATEAGRRAYRKAKAEFAV